MNNITGHTGLTALLGSPVAHSISPLMHNESFRLLGLDYVYLCFDVNEETLPAAVAGLKTCGIRGFNLTMPNKNKIVELLDELSPEAQLIGAVNTVLNDNGKLIGYNTDGYGFMQSVRDAGHDITGKNITVMGVGGLRWPSVHSLPWTVRLPYIFLPAAPADTGIAHRNSLRISLLKQVVRSASSTMMIILHCEIPLHRVIC